MLFNEFIRDEQIQRALEVRDGPRPDRQRWILGDAPPGRIDIITTDSKDFHSHIVSPHGKIQVTVKDVSDLVFMRAMVKAETNSWGLPHILLAIGQLEYIMYCRVEDIHLGVGREKYKPIAVRHDVKRPELAMEGCGVHEARLALPLLPRVEGDVVGYVGRPDLFFDHLVHGKSLPEKLGLPTAKSMPTAPVGIYGPMPTAKERP